MMKQPYRIKNNDTETIIVTVGINILSYLLGSYVTHVLYTVGSAMMKE